MRWATVSTYRKPVTTKTIEDGLSGSKELLGLKERRSYRIGQPSESESMACGKRYVRNVGGLCTSSALSRGMRRDESDRSKRVQGSQTDS